ncbi:unnamed protein product, partial [Nesidiocoris tenuis]
EVPIVQKFSKSLTLPRTIVIAGTVYLLPFGFHVNLQSGSYVYPHPVIPFHMSVRWRPCEDDVIIFNSWTDDGWDDEVGTVFLPNRSLKEELHSINNLQEQNSEANLLISVTGRDAYVQYLPAGR